MPANEGNRGEGVTAFLLKWWRAGLAELLSTLLLVALGVWSAFPVKGADENLGRPPLGYVAMAFGFVVTANAQVFGPTSGAHMNPAVTLGALLLGRLQIAPAALYLVAQCVGATLGFALIVGLAPSGVSVSPQLNETTIAACAGCTLPGAFVSPALAAIIEVVLTAPLVLLVAALWAVEDVRPDPAAPIKAGLLVAGLIYSGGALTGASMNPARSLGPALVLNCWAHHWVYWVGPLLGAVVAALLHRYVLTPPVISSSKNNGSVPEIVPLQQKPEC